MRGLGSIQFPRGETGQGRGAGRLLLGRYDLATIT